MTLKEWFTDYCQSYSPKGACGNLNCDAKPTIGLFFYNIYRNFKSWDPVYKTRMFLQKVFRLNHLSDFDIWEAQISMARRILPILHAFRKYDRSGFPSIYSEYEENAWGTKEEYDKAIEEGRMIGGGEKRWLQDVDHIIRSVEYVAWEGTKKINKWYLDNFGIDPYSEDERNKYKYWTYKNNDNGMHGMTFHKKPENENISELKEHETYGNSELLEYIEEYVNSGFQKLGYLWRTFWD